MRTKSTLAALLVSFACGATVAAGRGNFPRPGWIDADAESLRGAWERGSSARHRWTLNGVWEVRPALKGEKADEIPAPDDGWGWSLLPSVWSRPWSKMPFKPASLIPEWMKKRARAIQRDRAWYSRTFTMPAAAKGKRVLLSFDTLNTRAVAYLDGAKCGDCVFPGGSIDLTAAAKPGAEQRLVLDVTSYPLDAETLTYNAPDRADKAKAEVLCRGVTGDLWLDLVPTGARISNAWAETSVSRGEITFAVEGVTPARCVAKVTGCGETRTFEGTGSRFTCAWKDAKLWDTDTPENRYEATVAAYDAEGKLIDETLPFSFGFREVTVNGRDIVLNGKTIHLRAMWCPTPKSGSADILWKETCLETCRRLKEEGYNFIIAGNYNYGPGAFSSTASLLEACDETGILYSYTLPHIKGYGDFGEREKVRYRRDCAWAIGKVRNHPSVLSYAMNHNCTGYTGDQNPQKIDGLYTPEAQGGGKSKTEKFRNRACAREAWKIAKALDPTRIVYHHESGNLDEFHTINLYLNWAPRQERSDWLRHWSEKGVKPVFFVEWGMPHISTWSSWRGPEFIWRSSVWQSLMAMEGAADALGDRAYESSPAMDSALAHEESLWAKGVPMHWSRLNWKLHALTNLYHGVQAYYMEDNWKSHRAWGVSAALPWDQSGFHRCVRSEPCRNAPRAWRDVKHPGYAPSVIGASDQFICDTNPRTNWVRTAVGETMHRWNMPDCAFIGGDGVFTDKTHVYEVGATIRKVLVVLNDNRRETTYAWEASLVRGGGVRAPAGQDRALSAPSLSGTVTVPPGGRVDVPLAFAAATPGEARLEATVRSPASTQRDTFAVTVLAKEKPLKSAKPPKLQLYDPVGLTAANFRRLGIAFEPIVSLSNATAQLTVVGRGALTRENYLNGVVPIARNRRRALVFEQDRETLESIGFRVQEYGLRRTFLRFRDKRTEGLNDGLVRDWAGSSTLLTPFYGPDAIREPEVEYMRRPWAGFMNTRVWRCGNRNAVATVLPEKPTTGNWRALADGGFDLQFAPLLETQIGFGRILFCQFDVTDRTVADPAADALVRRLVARIPENTRGTPSGYPLGVKAAMFLRDGYAFHNWAKTPEDSRTFLVSDAQALPKDFLALIEKGAVAICAGLDAKGVRAVTTNAPACKDVKGRCFRRFTKMPEELNGLSNGHFAWHGAMDFAAFEGDSNESNESVRVVRVGKGKIVFLQVAPWMIDAEAKPYLRATKRRAEEALERVMGNLGFAAGGGLIRYRDLPVAEDDPYRYYRW